MILLRLLYFEVCSDALLCLYPLLHRLDCEGFPAGAFVVFRAEPRSSFVLVFSIFWFQLIILIPIKLGNWLEFAHEKVGVVGELLVTWSGEPLPLF